MILQDKVALVTASIPCGTRNFQISFDFLDHQLQIDTSDGIGVVA